jgi:hydrogenase expression/formation protein HypC
MSDARPGPCADDICITCGDVAVPVRVVRLLPGDLAVVDADGHEEEVSVAPTEAATLLVHAGEAIACVDDALLPPGPDKARRVEVGLRPGPGADGRPEATERAGP